jgi:hypothetical protein
MLILDSLPHESIDYGAGLFGLRSSTMGGEEEYGG